MKIFQGDDGSGYIVFNETEKKIIQEKSTLKFEAQSLRDFSVQIANLAISLIEKNPTKQVKPQNEGDEIKTD